VDTETDMVAGEAVAGMQVGWATGMAEDVEGGGEGIEAR